MRRAEARRSFEEYVDARFAALTRSAYLLTGNHHDAEDLVQAALVKAVAVWKKIEADPEPYVRRIMVNENISRWRKHKGREQLVEAVPETSPTRGTDAADDTVVLAEALAHLAPRQRTVLVLRYYEDLTERETAELMGIAIGTVKSQTRDALARLRAVSEDQGQSKIPL